MTSVWCANIIKKLNDSRLDFSHFPPDVRCKFQYIIIQALSTIPSHIRLTKLYLTLTQQVYTPQLIDLVQTSAQVFGNVIKVIVLFLKIVGRSIQSPSPHKKQKRSQL